MLELPGLTGRRHAVGPGAVTSQRYFLSALSATMWPQSCFMKAFTRVDEQSFNAPLIWFPTFQLFLVPVFLIGFRGLCCFVDELRVGFHPAHIVLLLICGDLLVGLFLVLVPCRRSDVTGDALMHCDWVRIGGRGLAFVLLQSDCRRNQGLFDSRH